MVVANCSRIENSTSCRLSRLSLLVLNTVQCLVEHSLSHKIKVLTVRTTLNVFDSNMHCKESRISGIVKSLSLIIF